MKRISFGAYCTLAFVIRLILIVYARFHDKYFTLPYTDVDYKVFTDAARHIVEGNSPFDRHTYRYTPLLALLLTPNIWLHSDFGKVLFSFVDILVAMLIKKILAKQNCERKIIDVCVIFWLYNPLTAVISTRGNADSLAVLLVLLTLFFLQGNNCTLAGFIHGLSIHLRLYPLAFSLAMYLSLRGTNRLLPNKKQLMLIFGCILSLIVLTSVGYYYYGYKFLYESFIYHLIRKDARHNFSVYFYMLYLSADQRPQILQRIFTFLPQLILLITLAFCYSSKMKLPFAMLTQAMVMVTYNPVLTSQYFFWFLSLLPLCLPHLKMSVSRTFILVSIWMLSQGFWLHAAYLLEFQGIDSFDFIWYSTLLFFIANIRILVDVIKGYRFVGVVENVK